MRIDKENVRRRFRRSMGSYEEHARVQAEVVGRLCPMAAGMAAGAPRRILEVGCGTGLLTRRLRETFPGSELHVNDLVEELCRATAAENGIGEGGCIAGDVEGVALPGGYDLVVSASTFQWFADAGATFRKLAGCLNEGGCMVFSSFGKDNLREIRVTTGGGLAYRAKEEVRALLEPCFEVERVEEEWREMLFESPLAVLRHLKRTGVNASDDRRAWTRGRVNAFAGEYESRFGTAEGVTLTYHPLYFACRKRGGVDEAE